MCKPVSLLACGELSVCCVTLNHGTVFKLVSGVVHGKYACVMWDGFEAFMMGYIYRCVSLCGV